MVLFAIIIVGGITLIVAIPTLLVFTIIGFFKNRKRWNSLIEPDKSWPRK